MSRKRKRYCRTPKSRRTNMPDDIDTYVLAYLDYTLGDTSLRHTFRESVVQHLKATHGIDLSLAEVVRRVQNIGRQFGSVYQDLEKQGTEQIDIPADLRVAIATLVLSIRQNALNLIVQDSQRVLRSSLQTSRHAQGVLHHVSLDAQEKGRVPVSRKRRYHSKGRCTSKVERDSRHQSLEADTQLFLPTQSKSCPTESSIRASGAIDRCSTSPSPRSTPPDDEMINESDQLHLMILPPPPPPPPPSQHFPNAVRLVSAAIGVLEGLESAAKSTTDEELRGHLQRIHDSYMAETARQRSIIRKLKKENEDTAFQLRISRSVEKTSQEGHSGIESLERECRSHLRRIDELTERLDQTKRWDAIQSLRSHDQQFGFQSVKTLFPVIMGNIQHVLPTPDDNMFAQPEFLQLNDNIYDMLECMFGHYDRVILRDHCCEAIRDCSSAVTFVRVLLAVTISRWIFETPVYEMDRNKGILHDHYRLHLNRLGNPFLTSLDLCVYQDVVQSDEWLETYTKPKAAALAASFSSILSSLFATSLVGDGSKQFEVPSEWMKEKEYIERIFRDALALRAQSVVGKYVFQAVWYPPGTSFDVTMMSIQVDDGDEIDESCVGECVMLCLQPALVAFKGGKEVCDQTSFVREKDLEKSEYEVLFKAVVAIDNTFKSCVDDSEDDRMALEQA